MNVFTYRVVVELSVIMIIFLRLRVPDMQNLLLGFVCICLQNIRVNLFWCSADQRDLFYQPP